MRKHKKDIDLIHEAYENSVQQLTEYGSGQVAMEDQIDDDNITDLEPGENITGIKKDAIIKAIINSVDELVAGNTGPDSPCGEREALELVERHCKGRLNEIAPALAGLGSLAAKTGTMVGATNIANKLTGGNSAPPEAPTN